MDRYWIRRKLGLAVLGGAVFAVLGLAVTSMAQSDDDATSEGQSVHGVSTAELDNPDAPLPPEQAPALAKPHKIPAGYEPPADLVEGCDRLLRGVPDESDPAHDPLMCKAILAFDRHELPPGEYTDAELRDYVGADGAGK